MQILIFLAVLSLVVIVHELGHFLVARLFGITVEEFGFGLPPRVARVFKKGETEYTINALPIGGFVKLLGENGEGRELGAVQSGAFWAKPVWQRGGVVVAGVVMNFLLAVVLFGTVYSFLGIPSRIGAVKVMEVRPNSPAMEVGLKEGDVIKNVQVSSFKFQVDSNENFLKIIAENKGREIALIVKRDGEEEIFKVVPRVNPPEGEGALGVVISDTELRHFPWWQMPFRGVVVGFNEAITWGKEILGALGKLVYRLMTGQGIEDGALAGPIGIYQVAAAASQSGVLALLQFVGILSVNLAILNIMPFPALDGGRLVFLLMELVSGRKLRNTIENWVNSMGMVVLLGLMLLITINDILRLLGGWNGVLVRLGIQ